jgi:DNA-binding NarL/FixJ family response regulator
MSTPAPANAIQPDKSLTAETAAGGDQTPIAVAVVEDSPTVRRNLNRWLDRTPGFQCVCTCANGVEALRVIPHHRPQVVLMDIQMPEMSGVECTARLKQLLPKAQIIVLTVYEDTETIFKALRAGACGYLLKRSSHQEILKAIRDILQGGAPMTSAIARKVVTAFQEPVAPAGPDTTLSARERDILTLLAQGLSNKEIGAKLDLSPFTVKNHLARVFEKLHVRGRTEAALAYLHTPSRREELPRPQGH